MAAVLDAGRAELKIDPALADGFNRKLVNQVNRPLDRAGEQAGRQFGHRFAVGIKAATVAIGAGLAATTVLAARGVLKTTKAASDLNETVNKTNVIFGRSAKEIRDWSQGSAKRMGLSRQEALSNAAAFGDMFLQLKLGRPQAVNMSKSMVALASDLASFNNADISDVLNAQQSAFRGEYDALQRFIPNINAARVEQEALRLTHKKAATDLTAAEKAQAAYNIMMRDSVRAQGDYRRTSKDLANSQRSAKAQWLDLQAAIGKAFLPAQLAVVRIFNEKLLPAGKLLAKQFGPTLTGTITGAGKGLFDMVPPADQLAAGVLRLGDRLRGVVAGAKQVPVGLRAMAAAFREGDVTSDGMVGQMERVGVVARKVWEGFRQVGPALEDSNLHAEQFIPTVKIGAAVLDLLAKNADLVVKHLPVLIGLWVAYKGAQGLANIAAAANTALKPLEIASNFALARSIKALRTSTGTLAATQVAQATTGKGAAASNVLAANAANKGRVATLASAAASKLAAGAALVWRGAQAALNLALTANPIGLVIAAVALLVAGIVIAYKRSETFRTIVHKVWDGVRDKVGAAVNFIISMLRAWVNFQFTVVEKILHVMGKLPGPMGAPFRKAEEAVKRAKQTVNTQLDKVQERVNRLRGKDIPITARTNVEVAKSVRQYLAASHVPGFHAQKGALLPGYGGGDIVPAMLEPGEAVVPKDKARRADFRAWAAAMGIPGFQLGGLVSRFYQPTSSTTRSIGQRMADVAYHAIVGLGGGSGAIKAWIRAQDPKPYRYGWAGPGAFDCSGIVSAVLGKMLGLPGAGRGLRLFTTASIRAGMYGLKSGLGGVLQIGVTPGKGHMSARYGGLGFEAESTRTGIKVGAAASRPERFARHFYHLAKGGLVDPRMVKLFARLRGVDVGGDPGRLRVNGQVLDQGGWLMPGLTLAYNGTGRPERVTPADGGPLLDARSARMLGRAVADALAERGMGAVYLDSRDASKLLAGASVANARRR